MRKLRNIIYQIVRRLRLLLGTGLKPLLVLRQRELPLNLQLQILQKLVQPHSYLYCFICFGSDVCRLGFDVWTFAGDGGSICFIGIWSWSRYWKDAEMEYSEFNIGGNGRWEGSTIDRWIAIFYITHTIIASHSYESNYIPQGQKLHSYSTPSSSISFGHIVTLASWPSASVHYANKYTPAPQLPQSFLWNTTFQPQITEY
jgi:hypothetical protein